VLAEIKGRILRRCHLPIQRVHRSEGKKEPSKAAKFIKRAECYAMSLGVRFVGSSGGRASPLVKQNTVSTNISRVPCLSHLTTESIDI
jgi:hypothetical protein